MSQLEYNFAMELRPALKEQAAQLPALPGVYLYKDVHGTVLYVGKAKSLRSRVRSYFVEERLADAKTGSLISEAAEVDYSDGSGRMRHEVFGWGKYLIGQYVATTRGYRNLKFFPRNDLEAVLQALHDNEAQLEQTGTATVYECNLPAPQWGSSLDT